METISVDSIIIRPTHRAIKPWLLRQVTDSMAQHGYNVAYPIVIDHDGTLVEGRHRVEAAKRNKIQNIPFIYKPAEISAIRFGLQCNADGQLTAEDDVFDLAELCWTLAANNWTGQDIANEVGFTETASVTNHKNIREKLSHVSWRLARNDRVANHYIQSAANQELAGAKWKEAYFRSFLKELPHDAKEPCRATMRAQVRAIGEILDRFADPQKKVTAAYCGEVGKKWAWYRTLAKDGFARLSNDVPLKDKKEALRQVYAGKFGNQPNDSLAEKFTKYIDSLNAQVLRLWLVHGKADELSFLADNSVDVIVTSPPYNLGQENWPMGGNGRESRDGIGYASHSDQMEQEEYERWQIRVLQELYRVAKPGASFFYNHKVRTVDGCLISPMRWLDVPDNPWILRQEIIWNRKSTHNHAESLFWPIDERIYWMTKGRPSITNPIGKPTVWEEFGPVAHTWHPAPFTEKLPEMLFDAIHLAPMSVVLDPFAGSCTTVKVALSWQCQAIGVDLERSYLQTATENNKWPAGCVYDANDIHLFGDGNE